MWILLARTPAPDATYWRGRRWLAAVDAVTWPAIAIAWILGARPAGGVVAPLAVALCAVNALLRLYTALYANRRYRFTTWRGARILVVLALIGLAMKTGLAWN